MVKYPELADKRVGWDLSNRIVEGFYDTRRFEVVEEKEANLKRMLDQWNLTDTSTGVGAGAARGRVSNQVLILVFCNNYNVI